MDSRQTAFELRTRSATEDGMETRPLGQRVESPDGGLGVPSLSRAA